ncbi:MAG: hypothetical protein EOO03_00465 [Chitinophagaceae bacterium]|nr:MAG: hypothetical protein EOO03_00465 [Chitinophagaceae bacterium]
MTPTTRFFLPLLSLFAIITILIFALKNLLASKGIDSNVLLVANGILLLLNILVFVYQKNALSHSNPNVFVRSVMSGMMLKMFVCAIAVLAYVLLSDKEYNKKSVFIAMFFYLFYLAVEVSSLMRLNNKRNA